jgi:hypothetical protein
MKEMATSSSACVDRKSQKVSEVAEWVVPSLLLRAVEAE